MLVQRILWGLVLESGSTVSALCPYAALPTTSESEIPTGSQWLHPSFLAWIPCGWVCTGQGGGEPALILAGLRGRAGVGHCMKKHLCGVPSGTPRAPTLAGNKVEIVEGARSPQLGLLGLLGWSQPPIFGTGVGALGDVPSPLYPEVTPFAL